jgi:hypothetical protein
MNKKLIFSFVLVLATLTGWAQEKAEGQVNPTTALLGSWSGKLNVGAVSLTLVLNLRPRCRVWSDRGNCLARGAQRYRAMD